MAEMVIFEALSNTELAPDAGSGLAEIVVRYTPTFVWLQRYDEGLLTDPRGHPGGELPPVAEARAGIGIPSQRRHERSRGQKHHKHSATLNS